MKTDIHSTFAVECDKEYFYLKKVRKCEKKKKKFRKDSKIADLFISHDTKTLGSMWETETEKLKVKKKLRRASARSSEYSTSSIQ